MVTDNKIQVLDSLRAFAALSVCAFHFVCTTTGYFENEVVLDVFSVGKYGVQMFFVISGFVIPWSMHRGGYEIGDFFRFFLKRLARLEPPYLFSLLIAITLLFLRQKFYSIEGESFNIDLKEIFLHFGYMIPFTEDYQWLNPVYWTLAVEFQYYLFMALLFVPLMSAGPYGRYTLYLIITVSSFISGAAFLFYWLPVFLMGILLFLFLSEKISSREFYAVLALLVAFCFYRYPAASVLYSIIPVCALLLWRTKKTPVLNYMGRFSYSIYLVHTLIGATVVNVLSHSFRSPVQKIGVVLLGFADSIFSAWLMYLIIERPSKRLSGSITYRQKSLPPKPVTE